MGCGLWAVGRNMNLNMQTLRAAHHRAPPTHSPQPTAHSRREQRSR